MRTAAQSAGQRSDIGTHCLEELAEPGIKLDLFTSLVVDSICITPSVKREDAGRLQGVVRRFLPSECEWLNYSVSRVVDRDRCCPQLAIKR